MVVVDNLVRFLLGPPEESEEHAEVPRRLFAYFLGGEKVGPRRDNIAGTLSAETLPSDTKSLSTIARARNEGDTRGTRAGSIPASGTLGENFCIRSGQIVLYYVYMRQTAGSAQHLISHSCGRNLRDFLAIRGQKTAGGRWLCYAFLHIYERSITQFG